MRKDTRFRRPDRSEIESKLPAKILSDPSEVSHWYRSFRDSKYCDVPREHLRAMRDAMITAMREENRKDPNPRKEKKAGVHYNRMPDGWMPKRTGA
jgi:hypothetical protein